MGKTHYKRPLPDTAIAFASQEGRQLFAEAMATDGMAQSPGQQCAHQERNREPCDVSVCQQIRPYVQAELAAAFEAERLGDHHRAFRRLERAHVLSQGATIEHLRVHVPAK